MSTLPSISDRFSLNGQIAIVTGASSGLGRHMAITLANAGARVALTARRVDKLEELAAEIQKAGGEARAIAMDVTDHGSVAAAFTTISNTMGNVRIVVNNAGVALTKSAVDISEEDWDFVVGTNLKGAWNVAQEAGRRMQEHGKGGSIINIASILGLRVAGLVAPYSAAKAGLIQLTQSLALEWARYGIRVNALAPGYFETELNSDFFASDAGQKLIKRIPQRRLGQMDDLNGPLLLLASTASTYMTGVTLPVDGGHLQSSL